MKLAALAILLFVLACSGEEPIVQHARPATATQTAATTLGEKTWVVHDVQMTGSIEAGFRFDPADLSIKVGDTVRWINSSGMPHNVAFYSDSIPTGALTIIEAVMPTGDKLGPMNGRILSNVGETFEMDFLSAPAGTYRYFSVPQESIGMAGTITVENE